jgi:hypothetical protein
MNDTFCMCVCVFFFFFKLKSFRNVYTIFKIKKDPASQTVFYSDERVNIVV